MEELHVVCSSAAQEMTLIRLLSAYR